MAPSSESRIPVASMCRSRFRRTTTSEPSASTRPNSTRASLAVPTRPCGRAKFAVSACAGVPADDLTRGLEPPPNLVGIHIVYGRIPSRGEGGGHTGGVPHDQELRLHPQRPERDGGRRYAGADEEVLDLRPERQKRAVRNAVRLDRHAEIPLDEHLLVDVGEARDRTGDPLDLADVDVVAAQPDRVGRHPPFA